MNKTATEWPFPYSSPVTNVVTKIQDLASDISNAFKETKIVEITEPNELPTVEATREGVKFIHFGDEYDTRVCTVAYRPCTNKSGTKMMEVAVTYKHPRDQYNRKIAARTAAQRFLDGRTVCLPLRGKNSTETYYNMFKVFFAFD